ncbi:MAG: CarD family transcriptional regulator [Planctomycetota bacterium]
MAGEVPSAETIPTLHRRIFAESAALREVAGRVGEGGVTTAGRAAGSAGAFLLASLGGSTARPILLVTSSLDEAERARRDWSTFLGGPVETFPPWESLFEEGSEPDPEIFRQRTEVLDGLLQRKLAGAVAPMQALLQPVARSADARDRRILLRSGDSFPPEELARALVHAGYRRVPQVARPGDVSSRGGIFDLHPREASHPDRLDYFGDEIDSIRTVSAVDLRSRDDVSLLVLTLLPRSDYFIRGFTGGEVTLLDRLPGDTVLAIASPREVEERCISLIGQWAPRRDKPLASELWARGAHLTRLHLEPLVPEPAHRPVMLPAGSVQGFTGNLERSLAALAEETARGTEARVYFRGEAEAERFREILDEAGIGDGCEILLGDLSSGFRWQEPVGGTFLPGSALLGRSGMLARRARRGVAPARAVDSFLELEAGDHVVHVAHGIGRFLGVRHLQKGRRRGDHLVIEYRDGVHLLVPAERIDLVQKYVGGGVAPARLDRLGGSAWARRRARVE